MNTDAIVAEVRDFLEQELGVPREEIEPGADLREDLGLDSLDLVELVAVLEDRVGIKVDQDTLADVRTVGDVTRLAAALVVESKAAA